MKLTAVRNISILKHSKIVLPSFLIFFSYLLTGYLLFPRPTIPTKVEGAATTNILQHTKQKPTPTTVSQRNTDFLQSINGTATAGASSSITSPTLTATPANNSSSSENSLDTPIPTIVPNPTTDAPTETIQTAPAPTNESIYNSMLALPTPTPGQRENGNEATVVQSFSSGISPISTTPPGAGTTVSNIGVSIEGQIKPVK